MFETSQVRSDVKVASGRVTMVSISVAVHTLVVVGALAASVASVEFPKGAPDQWMKVELVRAVPLPPRAPAVRPPAARPPERPHPSAATPAPAQPESIPNTVIPVEPAQSMALPETGASGEGVAEPGTVAGDGTANGLPDGVGEAATGSEVEGHPYEVGGEVSAPRVLARVDPVYPPAAARNRMPGLVIVQCLIDRQGRVRDVTVVKSSFGAFEQAAVEAVRQWRFSPGIMRGKAVDTIFRLTVTFSIRDTR